MRFLHIIALCSLFTTYCLAQQDRSNLNTSIDTNLDLQRRLYNGKEYTVPPLNLKGTRSFKDFNFVDNATIVYEGVEYNDVMLMYDIVWDEVVVRNPELLINICPIRPYITRFTLNDHEFIQIFDDTEGLAPGFYYKVYKSENFTVYGTNRKRIQEYTSPTARERRVIETIHLFLKPKDSPVFVPITNKRSLLRNFNSHRREINRYLRAQRLVYREDPELFVKSVLNFVDKIKEI